MSSTMPDPVGGFHIPTSPNGFGGPRSFGGPGGFSIPPSNNYGGSPYPPNNAYGGSPYPPQERGYPPMAQSCPPQGSSYPPPMNNNVGYPPNGGGYHPNGGGYNPYDGVYPPNDGGYPPARPPPGQFGANTQGPPPPPPPRQNGANNQQQRPPGPPSASNQQLPNSNPSLRPPPPRPTQQVTQSTPEIGKPGQATPRPVGTTGPQPSMYVPSGSGSGIGGGNTKRGLYWSGMTQQSTHVPAAAIRAGTYSGDPVHVGRVVHKDQLLVGMVTACKEGLVALYNGKPTLFHEYEVLCAADGASYTWVDIDGRFKPTGIHGAKPLPCGTEKSGEPTFIARTSVHSRDYVGRVSAGSKVIRFAHKGSEDKAKSYAVLCET
ncbi:hypothetical protein H4R19_005145 [Coemansia spiralis]|nr:hypothetical protein H4R19_005145 [Coemansia spiralis]